MTSDILKYILDLPSDIWKKMIIKRSDLSEEYNVTNEEKTVQAFENGTLSKYIPERTSEICIAAVRYDDELLKSMYWTRKLCIEPDTDKLIRSAQEKVPRICLYKCIKI